MRLILCGSFWPSREEKSIQANPHYLRIATAFPYLANVLRFQSDCYEVQHAQSIHFEETSQAVFPLIAPLSQMKVISSCTNCPPTYPHQNKAIRIRFFAAFQHTEAKCNSPAFPRSSASHTAAEATGTESKQPFY